MELTDLHPVEIWTELEEKIHQKSGMSVNVFDVKGFRITGHHTWPNQLCPAIKATDKGQSFICAVAHMNLAGMAQKKGVPVLEECDAGLLKLVVPIFVESRFLGAVGVCGYRLEDGEVDNFMIQRTTEIAEDVIIKLSWDIPQYSHKEAESLISFIQEELSRLIQALS